jgi:hypothetical protein
VSSPEVVVLGNASQTVFRGIHEFYGSWEFDLWEHVRMHENRAGFCENESFVFSTPENTSRTVELCAKIRDRPVLMEEKIAVFGENLDDGFAWRKWTQHLRLRELPWQGRFRDGGVVRTLRGQRNR